MGVCSFLRILFRKFHVPINNKKLHHITEQCLRIKSIFKLKKNKRYGTIVPYFNGVYDKRIRRRLLWTKDK